MRSIGRRLTLWAVPALLLAACGGGEEVVTDGGVTDAAMTPEDAARPLLTGPDKTWTYVPLPDTACGNGMPAGVAIYPNSTSKNAAIFFEGGGWCWNAANCVPDRDVTNYTFTGVSEKSVLGEVTTNKKGLFNMAQPRNVFRDFSIVYIPYCTGDLHNGDKVASYGIHHVGKRNVEAILARLVPAWAGMEQVVVTGVSAGGYGALLNYDRVQRAFGSTPVHLLTDAGPPVGPTLLKPELTAALFSAWNAALPASCPMATDLLSLQQCLATTYPTRRFGFIASEADWLLRRLFGRNPDGSAGPTIEITDWFGGLRALADAAAKQPLTRVFFAANDQHVYLDKDQVVKAGNTFLYDWVRQGATGDAAWASVVDDGDLSRYEPNPLAGGITFADPANDEAYGYPTSGGYTHQGDLRAVAESVSDKTLTLQIQTAAHTSAMTANGFDKVAFTVFFDLASGKGLTRLPLLSSGAPKGFAWDVEHLVAGGRNELHGTAGADDNHLGAKLAAVPGVKAKAATRTVTLTYNAADFGIASWSGVGIYVTTWDVDGGGAYLGLDPGGGAALFKGPANGPRILDDLAPLRAPSVVVATSPAKSERYAYPLSPGFDGTQDLLTATAQWTGSQVSLTMAMRVLSQVWQPVNGFDHVSFQVFVSVPGMSGVTALPKLNATMPNGQSWFRYAMVYGFGNFLYSPTGATADTDGMALNEIAGVAADVGAQSVALSFPASAFPGVQSLDGATVYITTWDFDGIGNSFRALDAMPAEWTYGGGTPNGARIQDAITLQLK